MTRQVDRGSTVQDPNTTATAAATTVGGGPAKRTSTRLSTTHNQSSAITPAAASDELKLEEDRDERVVEQEAEIQGIDLEGDGDETGPSSNWEVAVSTRVGESGLDFYLC